MAIGTVELKGAKVKALKADLLKNMVTLTFEVYLDQQMMDAKRELGLLAVDASPVDLTIKEQQMRFPGMGVGEVDTTPGSTSGPFMVQFEGDLGG